MTCQRCGEISADTYRVCSQIIDLIVCRECAEQAIQLMRGAVSEGEITAVEQISPWLSQRMRAGL